MVSVSDHAVTVSSLSTDIPEVIRDLGITFARHSTPDMQNGSAFDWHTFALREEFIR